MGTRSPFPPDCARKFDHVRRVAEGGFGEVHLAVHRDLGRQVAIKLLLADLLTEDGQVKRFESEAHITAAVQHPNVIEVVDCGAADRVPWIAYEWLPGRSLRGLLAEAPDGLATGLAVSAAAQVADALEAAHARGVLHRDIKPDNVLGADSNRFKVTDFGIAKWQGKNAVRTATGVVLGSPGYLAPEQIGGADASAASDIYATGVVLYELLTGRLPFEGSNPIEIFEKHLRAEAVAPSRVRPGVSPALDRVVARAMARRPEERFASAAELAQALRAAGAAEGDRGRDTVAHSRGDAVRRTAPISRGDAARTVVRNRPGEPAPAAAPGARRSPGLVACALVAVVLVSLGMARLGGRAPSTDAASPTPLASAPDPARPSGSASAAADRGGVPAPRRPDARELSALRVELYQRQRRVTERDDDRVSTADLIGGSAEQLARARRNVDAMAQELRGVNEALTRAAAFDLDGPDGLVLVPAVSHLLESIHHTADTFTHTSFQEVLATSGLIALLRAFKSHLDLLKLGPWRAPVDRWLAPRLAVLFDRTSVDDIGNRMTAWSEAAHDLDALGGQGEKRSFTALVQRVRLLGMVAGELGRLRRKDSRSLEVDRELALAGRQLCVLLSTVGPRGCPVGRGEIRGHSELDVPLAAAQTAAYDVASHDGAEPGERGAAVHDFLGVARVAGGWWWWQAPAPMYQSLHDLCARVQSNPAGVDPADLAEAMALDADVPWLELLWHLSATPYADTEREQALDKGLAFLEQAAPPSRPAQQDLDMRQCALERTVSLRGALREKLTAAGTVGRTGARWLRALARTLDALAQRRVVSYPEQRLELARTAARELQHPAPAEERDAVAALVEAVHGWEAAAPCDETRWLSACEPARNVPERRALVLRVLEDEYARLAAVHPPELDWPERVELWLAGATQLGHQLKVTPDRELAQRWLARFDELEARFACSGDEDEWQEARQLLTRATGP